jgi:hypothetical protein
MEETNKYAVALNKDVTIVGHVPTAYGKIFKFLGISWEI